MTRILFVLLFLTVFSSCKLSQIPKKHIATKPFVINENGDKITGEKLTVKREFFKKEKIVLDDKVYLKDKVKVFGDGNDVFANTGSQGLAVQIDSGKINIFHSREYVIDMNTGHGHTRSYYFIQHHDGDPVKFLNYRNLKPMVQPQTPEFKLLNSYKTTRTVQRIIGYGALGAIVCAFKLATNDNDKVSNLGVTLGAAGFIALPVWSIFLMSNKIKLLKTVFRANG